MGMAEMAVDAQGAEQVVRGDLLVDHLVQLLAAHRMVKGFPVLRLEPGHHRERRFLLRLGFARAAVGAQLIDLTAEGDQLPVQLIKGAEAEIAVFQQVGDGGAAFVNPAQQGAHERCLIEHARDAARKTPAGFRIDSLRRCIQQNDSYTTSSFNKYKKG